jgi:hypothetical protein
LTSEPVNQLKEYDMTGYKWGDNNKKKQKKKTDHIFGASAQF